MDYKQSIAGGLIAFILATACCWLPALIVILGGATGMLAFSESLESYSAVFMIIGAVLLAFGIYKWRALKTNSMQPLHAVLQSVITCPKCGAVKEETMPTDACAFFYKCESCSAELKQKEGECCVYCSYGSVPCPPIQMEKGCC